MKTHITLIRNTAAAFLLLQAAGILHATDIPVKTGYTITRDTKKTDGTTEKKVCCGIALSVENMKYVLTVPENVYDGYTAACTDKNGTWYILKKDNDVVQWQAVSDATTKEGLAKLFASVQNQKMDITTTDGTDSILTEAGYKEQDGSPELSAGIEGGAYKGIELPSLSGGRFYLAEYGTGKTYILSFKTSGSFMDLEAESLSKGRKKEDIMKNMFAWLEATDNTSCTDPALSEKLAEMLAESLGPDNAIDGLYTANGSEYIKWYLEKAYANDRNIYANRLHNSDSHYNPKQYNAVDETTGRKLADKAMKISQLNKWHRNKYNKTAGGRVFIADCIEQCKLTEVTGSSAFGKLLTDEDSLEKLTEYVPELKDVLKGDIITELVTDKDKTTENIGIVTASDGTGSTDGIKVVWLRSGRLYVETCTLTEFGKDMNKIRCRRLLQKTDSAGIYGQAEVWDVLDRTPVSAEFSIGRMREANQHGGGNWRWIPNTGEYLVLGDIKVTMKNRGGMKLLPSGDSEYEVTLAGAYDREYNSDKAAQGNIYNNTGTGFTAVVLDQGDSEKILSNGTLSDGSTKTVIENGKTIERYRYNYAGGQPFNVKKKRNSGNGSRRRCTARYTAG